MRSASSAVDRGDSGLHAFAAGYSDGLLVAGAITLAAGALALAVLRPGRNASTDAPVVADAA